jgi:precorrin-4/cobalt-precorrin-4 C11-methyltransferase
LKVIFVGAGPGDPSTYGGRRHGSWQTAVSAFTPAPWDTGSSWEWSLRRPDATIPPVLTLEDIIRCVRLRQKEQDVDVIRLHTGDPSYYGAIRETE